MLLVACLLLGACATASDEQADAQRIETSAGTVEAPVDPTPTASPAAAPRVIDCENGELIADVADRNVNMDTMRTQLALMQEVLQDTEVIWEQFDIQPSHLMADERPAVLISVDEAAGRCDAILAAVTRPELVRFVAFSEEDFSRLFSRADAPPWRGLITADLDAAAEAPDRPVWTSIGTGLHGVTSLALRADQEPLARTLHERYGPLIAITVGLFDYPADDGSTGGAADQPDFCGSIPDLPEAVGLTVVDVVLDDDIGRGRITASIRNDGDTELHLVPDRIAELTELGGSTHVTVFDGMQTDEGRGSLAIAPGATIELTAATSIAPCSSASGFSLPPGAYDVVFPIGVFERPAFEGEPRSAQLVVRQPVEIS